MNLCVIVPLSRSCCLPLIFLTSLASADTTAYDRIIRSNLYAIAVPFASRMMNGMYSQRPPAVRAGSLRLYRRYLTHPVPVADGTLMSTDPHAYWTDRAKMDPSPENALLCDFALSLHAISATEFNCERLFSRVDNIVGPYRTSISDEGIVALAAFSARAQEDAKRFFVSSEGEGRKGEVGRAGEGTVVRGRV
jgi:hypothetical protein